MKNNKSKKIPDSLFYFGIFIFSFILYVNTFQHKWVLDDFGAYKLNLYVTQGFDGFHDIMTKTYRHGSGFYTDNLYRPFSQLMFATEWQLSPDNPGLSHIINTIFYALCCVLLFALLRKLFNQYNRWLPLIITLLYAAHPIHTEVIANIKGRDDIMALLFILLSLLFTLKYIDTKKVVHLVGVFLFFLLAMFSKESSLTMLAAIPLSIYFFRKASVKQYILVFLTLSVPAVIYLMMRQNVLSNYPSSGNFNVSIVDNYFFNADLITGWATSIMLLGKYLILQLIPYQQVCDYSFNQLPSTSFADPYTLLSLVIHLGLIIYAIIGIRKKDPVAFGILFYIITLSIVSNLVYRIGSSFAERFTFIPSLGLIIAVIFAVYKIFKVKLDANKEFRFTTSPIITSFMVIILLVFSVKTIARSAEWKNQFTLFETDVKKSENSAHLRLYYGLALRDKALEADNKSKGESDFSKIQQNNLDYQKWAWKAIEQFKKGIEIYPEYADCYEHLGSIYYRLHTFSPEKKYADTAEYYYVKSIQLMPAKATTQNNLAQIYFERGNVQKAKSYYLVSIKIDPLLADAYYNLGSCYGMLSMYDSSFYYYRRALELYNPASDFDKNRSSTYNFMGLNYNNINKPDSAIIMYNLAIKYDPLNYIPYLYKAKILIAQEKFKEAIEEINKGIKVNPYAKDLYWWMGRIDFLTKNYKGAILNYSQYIKLAPNAQEGYVAKGQTYDKLNQRDSALYYFRIADRLQ
jgi:tetratricopeptide (TPR) repeat protein